MEGYYDRTLGTCLCLNVPSDASSYCDAGCRASALGAYVTDDGRILLAVGWDRPAESLRRTGRYYSRSDPDFQTLSLDGLSCTSEQGLCRI